MPVIEPEQCCPKCSLRGIYIANLQQLDIHMIKKHNQSKGHCDVVGFQIGSYIASLQQFDIHMIKKHN